jgi:hypothetical protein
LAGQGAGSYPVHDKPNLVFRKLDLPQAGYCTSVTKLHHRLRELKKSTEGKTS